MPIFGTIPSTANVVAGAITGTIGTSQIANAAVTAPKLVASEQWTATSSLGNTFYWVRQPIGNNLFRWSVSGDSYYAGTYINLPSGTGNAGTSLSAWVPLNVLYAECMRTKLYAWHGGEQQRAFSGFTYINDNANITRFNHSMPQVDAWFIGIIITTGQ